MITKNNLKLVCVLVLTLMYIQLGVYSKITVF